MSKPFKFKQFEIIQEANPQKIGTDSMLLGAWTARHHLNQPNRILDIGTGTGVLALMMAQSFPESQVTAIEPNVNSFQEASINFKNSKFSSRILAMHVPLQSFGAMEKFDLIICNPPYYDGSYLSDDSDRNNARHRNDLPFHELYELSSELLNENGSMYVVIPQSELKEHIERAFDHDLFLSKILHTVREDGERKRAILCFSTLGLDPEEYELLVKTTSNSYSDDYIELTADFYGVDLKQKKDSSY